MKYRKIGLFFSIFLLLLPITNVRSFSHVDYIKDGNYLFFLIDLEDGNYLELNLTHQENGNFTLFLFDRRPIESYVKSDKTLNPKIFTTSKIVDFSLDDSPYINYTALETKIYYIEVILVGNGPDTFTLTSHRYHANNSLTDNDDLIRYYLPIIPSYQLEVILISSIMTIGILILIIRKKYS
ncbi:MAG: Loki-CTERM sorting domain-containing protein [Promethearchaeota archaeon]|jgi:hypothetical protein